MLNQLNPTEGFRVEDFCFDKQIAFINDPSSFKTAVCSRRAGKTVACAAHLVHQSVTRKNQVSLYITLSRANAKRIIWNEIININRQFNLGGVQNETELSMRFPHTGSIIYCSGAKDKKEIEKFRGLPIALCYIDEAQSFKSYIQELIDDVISKALYDYNGTLCLTGTPGPVPAGYYYNCSQSPEWSHHSWTMFDNPFIEKKSGKTPQELVQRDLKRMGVPITHPTIQRECFGRWIADLDSLVIKYNKDLNHYERIPNFDKIPWEHVIGVDLGFDDADAIAVIGWHPKIKEAYLLEEIVTTKQGITELAAQIDDLVKVYKPLKIVMDTGGLGKKIAEEMRKRYQIPVQAAEKQRKFEYIELLNDALRTKKFFAKFSSQFAQDANLLEWDKDVIEKLKIADTFHSDIIDAVIYAFRESLHWTFEPEQIQVLPNTPEWYEKEEEEIVNTLEKELNEKKEDKMWGDVHESEWGF